MTTVPCRVRSSDGVTLAVAESGSPDAPTVVAIHGYPDNRHVWDGVVDQLADRFHVVTYDVRGCGDSDKPGARGAYRMTLLTDDLLAVLDAVSPREPVHLLAHDWGSIQAWPALSDPRFAGRIASYTSISGPSLDHAGAWLRAAHRHPVASLRQLAHSGYIGLFQLPGLPETIVRSGALDRAIALSARSTHSRLAARPASVRTDADRVNGLSLYRANMLPRLASPKPVRVDVPVQVIVADKDAFVTPALAAQAPAPWVDDLTVRTVSGGHWVVSERPDVIARLTAEFAERGAAAQIRARAGRFGGKLVVITGGARGIGRATALRFAHEGANVVVADIDDVAAKQVIDELHGLGVDAWSEHLDVSDAAQWEAFTATVRKQHGVPDVVVNNAGIGMGGAFLGTSADDWDKILGVNVWSVIHGCRLFAAQQVERGQGGHIVNIASAAAFAPSLVYPAYATTKAAVLMLTECLTPELAPEGIGVTAVCPGFINTDISRSTIHVGVDEQTARQRTEHQVASYQRRGYGPEKVAEQIVAAVAAGRPLAVITPEAKLFRALDRFAPRLQRRIAALDLNKIGRPR